jgi:uncharacterized protein YcfL
LDKLDKLETRKSMKNLTAVALLQCLLLIGCSSATTKPANDFYGSDGPLVDKDRQPATPPLYAEPLSSTVMAVNYSPQTVHDLEQYRSALSANQYWFDYYKKTRPF